MPDTVWAGQPLLGTATHLKRLRQCLVPPANLRQCVAGTAEWLGLQPPREAHLCPLLVPGLVPWL